MSESNPFYYQPLFTAADIQRCQITWTDRLWIWLLPTSVQINEGFAYFWKRWHGTVYLIRVENLKGEVVRRYD